MNSSGLLGLASDHEINIRKLGVQLTEMRAEAAERSNRLDARIDGIVASLAVILEKLDERK